MAERAVPAVLTEGDHGRIAQWRRAEAERVTRERRPDLWALYCGGEERPGEANGAGIGTKGAG